MACVRIVSLEYSQFENFAKYHPLNNYMQTYKYASLMSDIGFNFDFIGYQDDNGSLQAAALILTKKITGDTKYGYAPKGFLINYYDENLVKNFFKDLRKYYYEQNFIFIKFNPEIIIGQTDKEHKYEMSYNGNVRVIDILKEIGVKRRKELYEFNNVLPRFNAYINLKNFSINSISRNYRKKIRKCVKTGMSLVLEDVKSIDKLYPMLKTKRDANYYKSFYNKFDMDNSIDLLFVKVDFEKRLAYIRDEYNKEQQHNDECNRIIQTDPTPRNLNNKMASDKRLESFKNNIIEATRELKKNSTAYVAGALVVKHFNRVSIIASGYSEEFKSLNPNHFLYYAVCERYKPYFDFCDIGGVSGNFSDKSVYNGINQFKLKWNPTVYEFIGEFDLIISQRIFKKLITTNYIENEFNQNLDHLDIKQDNKK